MLLVFQSEILGNDFNDEQLKNIPNIRVTLIVFQLEILGINVNDEHSPNNPTILLTLMILLMSIQKIIQPY